MIRKSPDWSRIRQSILFVGNKCVFGLSALIWVRVLSLNTSGESLIYILLETHSKSSSFYTMIVFLTTFVLFIKDIVQTYFNLHVNFISILFQLILIYDYITLKSITDTRKCSYICTLKLVLIV